MGRVITIDGLIKIGKTEHIEALRKHGLIHCNTVKFFRDGNKEDEQRNDPSEGAISSVNLKEKNPKLFVKDRIDPISVSFTTAILNTFDEETLRTHLYCMYAITPDHITGMPFIDMKNCGFGALALLITKPLEFIERIKKVINDKSLNYDLVDYYDQSKDHFNLSVFNKPDQLRHQNEFRFNFKGRAGDVFEFKIGSIEDISLVLEVSKFNKLTLKRMA